MFVVSNLNSQEFYEINGTDRDTISSFEALKSIDLIYISWDNNPCGFLSEEDLRNYDSRVQKKHTITDSVGIQIIYSEYINGQCRDVKVDSKTTYMVVDFNFSDGKVETLLLSYYYTFEREDSTKFRNLKLAIELLKRAPNSGSKLPLIL